MFCKLIDIQSLNLKVKINDQYFTLFPWKKVFVTIKNVHLHFIPI